MVSAQILQIVSSVGDAELITRGWVTDRISSVLVTSFSGIAADASFNFSRVSSGFSPAEY